LKSLANRALDAVELQLSSGDSKAALAVGKYILQGTQLLGDTNTNLRVCGPMTPDLNSAILITMRAKYDSYRSIYI